MSGQPYRYASDVDKFRAEYMASLGLRSTLDDLNLQANKIYKETGALPPVSQMKDNRTTSEILADTEKLKQGLMDDLKPLGNANFILSLIQKVQSSTLNKDGSLFVFLAQRAPEIVRNLQKIYKYGIKGDTNDVSKFVDVIEDMYAKTKTMTEGVKTYFNRPASLPGSGMLTGIIKEGDIDSLKVMFDDVARKLMLKISGIKPIEGYKGYKPYGGDYEEQTFTQKLINRVKSVSNSLLVLKDFLSSEAYKMFTDEYLNQILVGPNLDHVAVKEFFDLYKEYVTVIEQMPKADIVFSLIKQFDNSLKNSNMKLSDDILCGIEGQFASLDQLADIIHNMEEAINLFGIGTASPPPVYPSPAMMEYADKKQAVSDVLNNKHNALQLQKLDNKYIDEFDEMKEYARLEQDFADMLREARSEEEHNKIVANMERVSRLRQGKLNSMRNLERNIDAIPPSHLPPARVFQPAPEGSGIKKRRGRPRGSGIIKPYSETIKAHTANDGIFETPRFVHFGKYLVNMHRLNKDGIFALKRPSGGNINEIPSMRISNNLSGVIKKMIGGGVPTYKELSTLSEPEKVYLHKVASKANIEDKFSIPTPSKDAEEKDMHQFEVMKGEIMSGNDNKEFIKKFKLLLMKLSKNGTLPKAESTEILHELAELGY